MEKIHLEDVEDAIKREKLFLKAATKCLSTLEFRRVEDGYQGELMRPEKEMEYCEKHQQKQVDRMSSRHNERRIRKKAREVDVESSDLVPEDFVSPMASNKETRRKNKKKYKQGVTRSLRKRQVRSRQKRHRH